MTKLTDLTPQQLADLLDWPLDKTRKWLEVAMIVSKEVEDSWVDDHYFGEFESRPGASTNVGLPLPSFDVRILKNNPRESVWRHYWYGN
jgi:hypothetical protein